MPIKPLHACRPASAWLMRGSGQVAAQTPCIRALGRDRRIPFQYAQRHMSSSPKLLKLQHTEAEPERKPRIAPVAAAATAAKPSDSGPSPMHCGCFCVAVSIYRILLTCRHGTYYRNLLHAVRVGNGVGNGSWIHRTAE